jgi:hypothetical protein
MSRAFCPNAGRKLVQDYGGDQRMASQMGPPAPTPGQGSFWWRLWAVRYKVLLVSLIAALTVYFVYVILSWLGVIGPFKVTLAVQGMIYKGTTYRDTLSRIELDTSKPIQTVAPVNKQEDLVEVDVSNPLQGQWRGPDIAIGRKKTRAIWDSIQPTKDSLPKGMTLVREAASSTKWKLAPETIEQLAQGWGE